MAVHGPPGPGAAVPPSIAVALSIAPPSLPPPLSTPVIGALPPHAAISASVVSGPG